MASTNAERSARTRNLLLATARRLFARHGYATTSTPTIATTAQVTRGALYYHFADKLDIFRAVVEGEQAAVAVGVEAASTGADDLIDAIKAGGVAYLDAMRDSGRRRILLIDGPAVLGVDEIRSIEARHAGRTLAEGVRVAIEQGVMQPLPVVALTDVLDAAFDRVTMVDTNQHRAVLWAMLDNLRVRPVGWPDP